MRAMLIGFGMIATSLAVIIVLSTVLQIQAERGHPVDTSYDPRQGSILTVAAKNTSSFFQRMAHHIFHGHDASAAEAEK